MNQKLYGGVALFDSVVANKGTVEMLSRAVAAGSLSHALIIEGDSGSGKHTLAFSLAAALAGGDASTEGRMRAGLCPDVRLIGAADGRKTIGVETVREMTRLAYITSNEFDFRMFIIENAEAMTASAQNAFLKLLEEPPSGVYFVLLCTSSTLLLPTVRSRAVLLRTERCSDEEVKRYVLGVSPRARAMEGKGGAELDGLVRRADGVIGEALRLIERAGVGSDKARLAAEGVIKALTSRSGAAVMLSLPRLSSDRAEAVDILELVLEELRRLLLTRISGKYTDDTAAGAYAEQTDALSTRELCGCMETIGEARCLLLRNGNVRLALTSAAMKLKALVN